MALNQERAAQEALLGEAAAAAEKKAAKRAGGKKAVDDKSATKKRAVTGDSAKPGKRHKIAAEASLFPAELTRQQRFVLMLLRAWGKPLTRRALNAGMILMLEDALRSALLGNSRLVNRGVRDVAVLNHVYTELDIDGFITVDSSGQQQVVRITETAPTTDDASQEDMVRLNAVKEYFRREAETGHVTLSEEAVDAELDFVRS